MLHTSVSVLAIEIITGRQHQIRSHSAHIGHPLLRDGTLLEEEKDFENLLHCSSCMDKLFHFLS